MGVALSDGQECKSFMCEKNDLKIVLLFQNHKRFKDSGKVVTFRGIEEVVTIIRNSKTPEDGKDKTIIFVFLK